MNSIETFQTLLQEEKERLCEAFTEATFNAGEMILRQGTQGTCFYVLKSGKLHIWCGNDKSQTEVMQKSDKQKILTYETDAQNCRKK